MPVSVTYVYAYLHQFGMTKRSQAVSTEPFSLYQLYKIKDPGYSNRLDFYLKDKFFTKHGFAPLSDMEKATFTTRRTAAVGREHKPAPVKGWEGVCGDLAQGLFDGLKKWAFTPRPEVALVGAEGHNFVVVDPDGTRVIADLWEYAMGVSLQRSFYPAENRAWHWGKAGFDVITSTPAVDWTEDQCAKRFKVLIGNSLFKKTWL